MKEILWHGRGGQGAFTASILLGTAYTIESNDHYALAFPSFGPERRGAPIRAFNRISEGAVGDRSVKNIEKNRRNIVTFDASGLAAGILGISIANTAVLGFWAGFSGEVSLDALIQGIRTGLNPKLHEGNIRVVEEAYARGRAHV